MNNKQTIEKLKKMRLGAMAHMHEQQVAHQSFTQMTPDEYLALLTDHEYEHRLNNKINRLRHQARFKEQVSLSQVDYSHPRSLEKNMFQRLATLGFIERHENIIMTGAAGVGKSFLAQALGNQACQMGYKVSYSNTARLLKKLMMARVDGSYLKTLTQLSKVQVLILDDFGLQSFDNHARDTLMDIIDDRHQQSSTIIASQLPVSTWHQIIGEGTVADAILDRIVNSSHRINLTGKSMRKAVRSE